MLGMYIYKKTLASVDLTDIATHSIKTVIFNDPDWCLQIQKIKKRELLVIWGNIYTHLKL